MARLHSGDPSLYSALAEQCRRLDALGIDYEIVPGVPAFAAAAAVLGRELTVPGVAQTVTLTRVATLSTAMPPGEDLETLSAPGATLVLHLAAAQVDAIVPQLLAGGYRAETPCAVVAFASWPQQAVLRCTPGRTRRPRCTPPASPRPRSSSWATCWPPRVSRTVTCTQRIGVAAGPALMRVLLLGGTAEARALAARLHPGVEVISSLAGRVPNPALPAGEVRDRRLRRSRRNAAMADGVERGCGRRRHPSVRRHRSRPPPPRCATNWASRISCWSRPPWPSGDAIVVESDAEAAKTIDHERFSRVFLTTGRSGVTAFRDLDAWFLIRAVTAPDAEDLAAPSRTCAVPRPVPLRRRAAPCSPSTASTAW